MKYGLSLLLGEYLCPQEVDYADSQAFQIVCPECYEPIFKVSRENNATTYFSHYKKNDVSQDCSLRVDTLSKNELDEKSNIARGQNMTLFLQVFKDTLVKNELTGNIDNASRFLLQKNKLKGFALFKKYVAEGLRGMANNNTNEEIHLYFDDYLQESEIYTQFAKAKQKEMATDLIKHLCTEKAAENLGFLISYAATIGLPVRLFEAKKTIGLLDFQKDMLEYLHRLTNCGKEKQCLKIMREMHSIKLGQPYCESPDGNLLLKTLSEVSHECIGAVIRFPFFPLLQEQLKLRSDK